MISQLDQWLERAKTIPERTHLAQVGELHTVLTGANEVGGLRLRVALGVQFVHERVPDVVPRQLVLLTRRGPREASFRELRREVRIGRERERAGPDAAAENAVERERACVSSQQKLDRAVTREPGGGQTFQPIERDVRVGG